MLLARTAVFVIGLVLVAQASGPGEILLVAFAAGAVMLALEVRKKP